MLQRIFIFLFSLIICSSVFGQENIHYSQWYNSPLLLNPALTGQIGDDAYRLNAHARRQWMGLAEDNGFLYETSSGSIDLSLLNKRLGFGLFALLDRTGGGIYNTISVMPSLSYSFIMGDNALTFGAQGLINVSSIDPKSLKLPTPEPFNPSVFNTDLAAGINYKHDFYFLVANFGIAAKNVMQTPISYLQNGVKYKPPMQYKAYVFTDWDLTDRLKIMPGFFSSYQGAATNFVFGSNLGLKYAEGGTFGSSLILGLWARTNNGNLESLIPKFGNRFDKFQLMASYDYNVALSKGGSSPYFDGLTNTFEISIIFTGKPKVVPPVFEDDFILNPRF
jgi:type IX secretion system PorP/SprF family membrane protein